MTPEQLERRACTREAVEASRPEWFPEDETWDPFFPEVRAHMSPSRVWDWGKRICQDCPDDVKNACLELGRSEPHGVWGGTAPKERGAKGLRGGPYTAPSIADTAESWVGVMSGWFTAGDLARVSGADPQAHTTSIKARLYTLAARGVLKQRVDETGVDVFRRTT